MINQQYRQPAASERLAEFMTASSRHSGRWRGSRRNWRRPWLAASLGLSLAVLGACSRPVNCSGGDYRGGCVAGPDDTAPPVVIAPVAAPPVTGRPAVVNPSGVSQGDPRDFAIMDDRQCRSYGLTFGSHDYADCRIRLSAQHRGMDPGLGAR